MSFLVALAKPQGIEFLTIFLISLFNEEIRYRVLTTTLNQINFTDSQPYYKMERTKNDNLVVIHSDSTLLPRVYHMYIETGIKIFNDNILIPFSESFS